MKRIMLFPLIFSVFCFNSSAAEKDFLVFRSLRTWHYSYIYDYQAYLESVDKEIDVRVFSPLIAPQLSDCDK